MSQKNKYYWWGHVTMFNQYDAHTSTRYHEQSHVPS